MRLLLTLFLLSTFSCLAQIEIQISAKKQVESFQGSYVDFVKPTFNYMNLNDYYSIGAGYTFQKWHFHSELSYLYKDYEIAERAEDVYYYGYNARVNSQSIGFKVGANRVLFDGWYNLLLGVYLQSDFQLNEQESDHLAFYYYQAYSPGGASYFAGSESNQTFNAVQSKKVVPIFGISTEHRFNLGKMFIAPFMSGGLSAKRRSVADPVNPYDNPMIDQGFLLGNGHLNFEYGLKIGYTFASE